MHFIDIMGHQLFQLPNTYDTLITEHKQFMINA